MKTLHRLLLLAAGLSLSSFNAFSQSYTYYSNYLNVDYSGLTPNGGIIVVPLELIDGDVGTSPFGASFNVTYTVSPITNLPGASDVYNWAPLTQAAIPGFYGLGFPDSIYTDLPVINQQIVPYTINGVPLEAR